MQWRQVFQIFRDFFAFQPFSAGELWWFDTAWFQSELRNLIKTDVYDVNLHTFANLNPIVLNMSLDKVRSCKIRSPIVNVSCADCLHKELYQEDGNTLPPFPRHAAGCFSLFFQTPEMFVKLAKLTKPSDLWTQEFSIWIHGAFDIDEMNRINFASSPSLTLSLTFWGCKGQSYRQGRPRFQWVGTTRRSWEINSQHGQKSKMNILHVYYAWYRYNCG